MSEPFADLGIRVQPRASLNQIVGWREGALAVRLTAPPVEGAANKALVEFFAGALGLRRADVTLISGEKSREKRLRIAGLTAEELAAKIGALVPEG